MFIIQHFRKSSPFGLWIQKTFSFALSSVVVYRTAENQRCPEKVTPLQCCHAEMTSQPDSTLTWRERVLQGPMTSVTRRGKDPVTYFGNSVQDQSPGFQPANASAGVALRHLLIDMNDYFMSFRHGRGGWSARLLSYLIRIFFSFVLISHLPLRVSVPVCCGERNYSQIYTSA